MAICPECGEHNRFDGAAFCRKCGANLNVSAKSSTENDKLSGDQRDTQDSAKISRDDSLVKPESLPLEYTVEESIEEPDAVQPKSSFDESSSEIDPSMFEGTNEVDLSDQTDDIEDNSELETGSEPEPETKIDDAVDQNKKKELIESLRSKIPSMTNGNDHATEPDNDKPSSDDAQRTYPEDIKPEDGEIESDAGKSPKPATPFNNAGFDPKHSDAGEDKKRLSPAAHFSGSKLYFDKSTKFSEGEHVIVGNKSYSLRPRKKDYKTLTLIGTLATVILLLLVSSIVKNGSEMVDPSLVGVVVDESNHRVLTDVKVTVLETGKSVTTNQDGMFIFDMVPEGIYTIHAETPFFEAAQATVQHGNNRNSLIAIDMRSSNRADMSNEITEDQVASKEPPKKEKVAKYGVLDIATEFDDAEIFLDNRSYGKGSRKIRKVWAGKHKLIVKLDGYNSYEQTVRIKPNKTTKVNAELVEIPKETPPEPTAEDYIRAGDQAVANRSYYAAIAKYNEALKLDASAKTYVKRAGAFRAAGHPDDAIKDFMKAGRMFASVGQVSSAISAFSNVLDMNPDHLPALRARGYAYIRRGEYELALADFKSACDENKKVYENFIGLGDAYSVLGKYKEAIKAYKKAEKLTDDKSDVYALIALASLSRGKEKDAKKYYHKFIEAASPEVENKYSRDPDWQRLKKLASRN